MANWEGKPTLASVLKGYTPPTESALADPIKEHLRTLPAQLATNQAALDNAIASWNKTDFATGKPNPNYRPEAIQELAQLMPGIGGLTAWHGTPHKIVGNFDISKVGTGEGAQAYGHGMYFAENPEVSKGYQQVLGKSELSANGVDLEGAQKLVADRLRNSTYEDTLNWINSNKKSFGKEKTAEYKNALESLKNTPIEARTGNLYKVDIPDEYIPNMLDWDKPVAEDMRKRISEATMEAFGNGATGTSGEKLYKEIVFEMRRNGSKSPEADAAKWLNEQGIKGIRYEDAGSRGKTGIATSNFVVFDPSTVKILEKNKKKVGLLD